MGIIRRPGNRKMDFFNGKMSTRWSDFLNINIPWQGTFWASRCCLFQWLKQTILAARKPIDKDDSNMCDHWEQWTTIIIKHQSWNTIKHHQALPNIFNHQTMPSMINHQSSKHQRIFRCRLEPNTPCLLQYVFICLTQFNSTKTRKNWAFPFPFSVSAAL